MNRLASATSPYLLQHADNPVDWWQWSPDAFAEARRRDVPVLISVGYAACHWCHVMAHESFDDPRIAAAMNADFVCIKVDREERPDVDAVYMEATQAMTGQGGWPMTVFATPAGDPFYCGTYYPARSGHGLPSFPELLAAVASAWRDRRDEVVETGAQVAEQLSGPRSLGPSGPLTEAVLDAAADALLSTFDVTNGGFGRAPKFPPSTVLEFLLRHRARTGSDDALWMVEYTAERMARGGMYDQLAGGFARYAVDERWVVPHFEKMLYDNALLLRVYTGLWRETGSAFVRRIAVETAGFLIADLRTPEGGFASALDADTDGEEGSTYVWTPSQLDEVLGPDDGTWAARLLAVDEGGTFEHGTSVAQLLSDPDDAERWASVRSRLLQARRERPQPARDDKVVASWNGLAVAALADAGLTFAEPSFVDAAVAAGRLLRDLHLVDGRLRRVSRAGVVGEPAGVLEDYANVAAGWLALHQATGSGEWLAAARELLDVAGRRFADPGDPGGFFDTADDAERLFRRPADPADGPTPAGVAALCEALVTATALSGDPAYRGTAESALARLVNLVERAPRAAGWAAAVGEALLAGPVEMAVAGPPGPARDNLAAIVRAATTPGRVAVVGEPDSPGVPLLADRRTPNAPTAAYVCRGFVCDAPTADAAALAVRVRALR